MEVQTAHLTAADTGTDLSIDQQIFLLIAEGPALLACPAVLRRCADVCGLGQLPDMTASGVEGVSRWPSTYDLYLHRRKARAARGAASII